MRLTKKELMNAINQPMCFGSRLVGKKMFAKIIEELCEYKTIEEKFGIDLITLFKALKNGIYCKSLSKNWLNWFYFDTSSNESELFVDFENHCFINAKWSWCGEDKFYFKDYGKTWALTKEELL